MRIARSLAQGKSLIVESHVDEAVAPAYVEMPHGFIMLVNLMGNAIKFTSEGACELRRITTSSEAMVTRCNVVIDTGIGIPLPIKAVIFDAFTHVDSSITREFGGTGLGLFHMSGNNSNDGEQYRSR